MPVIVHGPKGHIPVPGLIDSGADESCFPVEYASTLGVELDECDESECRTAGGPTKQYKWDKPLEVQLQTLQNKRIKVGATFIKGLDITLLGRDDFFAVFKVDFDHRDQKFWLEPYE